MTGTEKAFDRAFSEAVLASLGFLQTDFGLTLKRNGPGSFLFDSSYVRVAIDLDRHRINISLEPMAAEFQRPRSGGRQRLALEWIVRYFGHPVDVGLGAVRSPGEVAPEVEKLGDLLRRFCSQLLKGDLTQWPQIYEYAKRQAKGPR